MALDTIKHLSETGVRRRRRSKKELRVVKDVYGLFKENYKRHYCFRDQEVFSFVRKLREKYENKRATIEEFENVSGFNAQKLKDDKQNLIRKKALIGNKSVGENRNPHHEFLEDIGEYVLMHAIDDGIMVPDDVGVVPGSQFDDLYNGVDFIVPVYDKKKGNLKWSFYVDVKTGKGGVEKSLDRMSDNILSGRFFGVKYFKYKQNIEDDDFSKSFRYQMPSFVLYSPKKDLNALLIFLAKSDLKKSVSLKREIFNYFRRGFFIAIKDYAKTIINLIEENKDVINASSGKINSFLRQYKGIIRWCNKYLTKDDKLKEEYKFQ